MAGRQPLDCRIGYRLSPNPQPQKSQGSQTFPHPCPCTALNSPFRARALANVSNSPPFRQQITSRCRFGPLDSTAHTHSEIIAPPSVSSFREPSLSPRRATHATHPKYKGKSCTLLSLFLQTHQIPQLPPLLSHPAPPPPQHTCQTLALQFLTSPKPIPWVNHGNGQGPEGWMA